MFTLPSAPVAAHTEAHKSAILAVLAKPSTGPGGYREWSQVVARAAVVMGCKADSRFNAECRGAVDALVAGHQVEQDMDGFCRLLNFRDGLVNFRDGLVSVAY